MCYSKLPRAVDCRLNSHWQCIQKQCYSYYLQTFEFDIKLLHFHFSSFRLKRGKRKIAGIVTSDIQMLKKEWIFIATYDYIKTTVVCVGPFSFSTGCVDSSKSPGWVMNHISSCTTHGPIHKRADPPLASCQNHSTTADAKSTISSGGSPVTAVLLRVRKKACSCSWILV